MARLVTCGACERHVKSSEGTCPFCGNEMWTSAPSWLGVVVAFPLALAACAGGEAKPGSDAAPRVETVKPRPSDDASSPNPDPAGKDAKAKPEGLGAESEPEEVEPERPMPTKYGMPPTPPGPEHADDGATIDEPELPPRPAKKYGKAPKPDQGDRIEKPEKPDRRMKTKYGKAPNPPTTPDLRDE